MKKREVFKLLAIYLLSTFFFLFLSFMSPNFLPYKPSFPYASEFFKFGLPQFLYSFANFDGVHYLTIAEKGYLGTGLIQAFFPIFPLLIRFFNPIFNNYLLTSLTLSQLFSLTAIFSFYYLVKIEKNEKTAFLSSILLSSFLSSFYLKSVYNEGLFLTLIFTSFIAAKKNKNLMAGILGALASATRIVGIFIWPALIINDYLKNKKINWKNIIYLSISALGLLAYMIYLKLVFGDPLYFFHLQEEFGASRQSSIVLFPQVIWRYFKILWTARPFDWKYYAYVQEFIVSLLVLFLLILISIKNYQKKIKVKWGYLFFALASFFLPTMTGNLSSMPRYVLVCFPVFVYLASIFQKKEKGWLLFLYLTINSLLLIINTILFIRGYWVS
jgi:Gpi18-like mannosyltransferase